jgi:hypothetical protein
MSVTISAVPAATAADLPPPAQTTAIPLADFVASLQNDAMSGMPQLANPAALASEIFTNLRGFFERVHYYEKLKLAPGPAADGGDVMSASTNGERLAELPGGSARDNPVSTDFSVAGEAGEDASSTPQSPEAAVADLRRVMEFCLKAMNFSTEATLMGSGTSQAVRSVNTLLRGD